MTLAALTTLAIAGLFLWFYFAQRSSSIEVSNSEISIHIPIYGRTINANEIVPGSIQTISLTQDTPFRLTWRTNGLGVPGYQLG